ncbi:unnamed protein product [Diamesa serratosioi]
MDPLVNIVDELHDLIFQHFYGDDVINAFLCSKTWNRIISNSKLCMSKIKMEICYKIQNEIVEEQYRILYNYYLMNGPRHYQNLDINMKKGLTTVLPKECFKILELMISSLSDIVLINVIISDNDVSNKLHIPNLQYLRMEFCSQKLYDVLLKSSKSLISLELSTADVPIEISILYCLKTNPNLKILHCRVNVFHMIFKTDVADLFKFQLEKFYYESDIDYNQSGPVVHDNFLKFLKNNCSDIKVIELQTADVKIVNFIFNEMENVKEVAIMELNKNEGLCFKENKTVESLELNYVKSKDELKPFVDFLPNLKTLNVNELDNDMIFYAATFLEKLTAITYEMIGINTIEYYEHLKKTIPHINRNIDIDW